MTDRKPLEGQAARMYAADAASQAMGIEVSIPAPGEAVATMTITDDMLNGFEVLVPPLRERREDIPLLVDHFVRTISQRMGRNITEVPASILRKLREYDWPGNVRHLKHCIESAMNIVAVDATVIQPYHLPAYMGLFSNPQSEYSTASALPVDKEISSNGLFDIMDDDNIIMKLQAEEKKTIIQTMQANKGNITKTANQLKISRQRLQYRLKKYGLKHLSSYINYSSVIGSQRH